MRKCVLIFDDDQEILFVCKIILEKHYYYRIETRLSCDNIFEDISVVRPDIILMDLWIPEIGGENAIKLLKNNQATWEIPIVIFSANAEIEEISNRTKANGFLEKPFEISALLNIIKINILQ